MLLGHDVVADREAEAGSLADRFGREERLKMLVFDLRWDTGAIVTDSDFDLIAKIARRLRIRFPNMLQPAWKTQKHEPTPS